MPHALAEPRGGHVAGDRGDGGEAGHARAGGHAAGRLAGRALRRPLDRRLVRRRRLGGGDRGEVGPRVVEPEAGAQRRAVHARAPARPDHLGGDDARRAAALDDPHAAEAALDQAAEPAAGLAEAHADRPPAVARRGVVVRVLDGLEPRLRLVAERGVLDALRAPAGGREEERDDRAALVGDDLAGGLGDGLVGRVGLHRHAAVDLRARVGVVLEAGAALGAGDGVRARSDRLGLERLERPRGGRLDAARRRARSRRVRRR